MKSKKPDLVLLDLGLPIIDGFEVLKRIRADAETKLIPVIFFTILGEQKDIKKGILLDILRSGEPLYITVKG